MLTGITIVCFAASYGVALLLEVLGLLWPRRVPRLFGVAMGAAGLLAHTLYLIQAFFLSEPRRSLSSRFDSLLLVAWILAGLYVYASLQYRRLAWGLFVLPVVEALIALAWPYRAAADVEQPFLLQVVHVVLLTLTAFGACIGFLASVMYLIQAHRLKAKTLPNHGLHLLSLERLEKLNRRAIALAFPLLTAGMILGVALMVQQAGQLSWTDPHILAAVILWLLLAALIYLGYGHRLRGRRLAVLTIVAFGLLLFTLAWPHLGAGGIP